MKRLLVLFGGKTVSGRILPFFAICFLSQTAAAQSIGTTIPDSLSVSEMFAQADWVVKSVIIGLAIASVVSWTIFIAKTLELKGETKAARILYNSATQLQSLRQVSVDEALIKSQLVLETLQEVELSNSALQDGDGLKERILSRFDRYEDGQKRRLTRGIIVLATIGSTAPFVGLFGTVWGIMNSFIGIAETQTTSLAVVAPGIAEALLATALGLIAAIPAVVMYNHFIRQITAYLAIVTDTAAALLRLVSRDLSHNILGADKE